MSSKVHIRSATPSDARLLWELRNDPLVRENSFTNEFVPWDVHRDWCVRKFLNPDTRIYILEDDQGRPLGQIRFERQHGDVAEIHLSVLPGVRGRGYGRMMLSLTLPLVQVELNVARFEALVKIGNQSSLRLFRGAGFTIRDELTIAGSPAIRLVRVCSIKS